MCGLCGSFQGGHWSDGVAEAGGTPTADRVRRARIANEALDAYSLTLKEWAGRYTLISRTGRAAVVDGYGALWPTAERLCGRECDPLDEAVIRRLEDAAR